MYIVYISNVKMLFVIYHLIDISKISFCRSSQNGSSPGSGQSGPTYHNTSAMTNSNLQNNSNSTGLVVNSVARKKKTERLVPPVIHNHSSLMNGTNGHGGSGYMNSTGIYSPMTGGGLTNPAYARDNIG